MFQLRSPSACHALSSGSVDDAAHRRPVFRRVNIPLDAARRALTARETRNSAIYLIGNLLPAATSFLLLPFLTRALTPRDFGVYGYTAAVSGFLAVLAHVSIHS